MDGVSTEVVKAGGEMVIDRICGLYNQVWESGGVPEDCGKNGSTVCNPKKGNLNEYDSWRGVTLLSIPGKVHCQMILNCM